MCGAVIFGFIIAILGLNALGNGQWWGALLFLLGALIVWAAFSGDEGEEYIIVKRR